MNKYVFCSQDGIVSVGTLAYANPHSDRRRHRVGVGQLSIDLWSAQVVMMPSYANLGWNAD